MISILRVWFDAVLQILKVPVNKCKPLIKSRHMPWTSQTTATFPLAIRDWISDYKLGSSNVIRLNIKHMNLTHTVYDSRTPKYSVYKQSNAQQHAKYRVGYIFDTIDSSKFLKPDIYNKMLNAHVTIFLYHNWYF